MNWNLEIKLSCKYKILQYSDRNFNTDWQFGMFKRGKDNAHDT